MDLIRLPIDPSNLIFPFNCHCAACEWVEPSGNDGYVRNPVEDTQGYVISCIDDVKDYRRGDILDWHNLILMYANCNHERFPIESNET